MREGIVGGFVGQRVERVEDERLLTGKGLYVDDVHPEGVLHAAFLRSSYAHARIVSIDTSRARRARGVFCVLTGDDMERLTNPFINLLSLPGLYTPVWWCLARERVRNVGDPVAIVVALSRAMAEDALESVEVIYEPLEPVASIDAALDAAAEQIWPGADGNVLYRATDDHGDVDAAFAGAHRVITETFHQHRQSNQPMETRGILAEVGDDGSLTLRASHQSSHLLRWGIGLLTGRQGVMASLKDMIRQRERIGRFFKGAKSFADENPDALGADPEVNKTMAQTMRREPSRILHLQRSLIGLLAKDPKRVPRVVATDVGGAFGAKTPVSREDVAVAATALHLGRSVKWIEDRNEHLLVGGQAREENVRLEAAVDEDGRVRGLKVELTMDHGAYPAFPFGAPLFSRIISAMIPGPYDISAVRFDTTVVATNKGTYVAYRGPWAVETWVRERMLDIIAAELGIDRIEVRRRNLIDPADLPRPMVTGPMLDERMSAKVTFERAMELAEAEDWDVVRAAALEEGRLLGLGFATYHEAAPGPPDFMDHVLPGGGGPLNTEPARTTLTADGNVEVFTQQMPHGQGHETTLAQVAADQLDVPIDQVRVRYGDTSVTPFALMGTGGSRSAAMAGGAVTFSARELREKIVDEAADLLEAAPGDLEITNGAIHVAGVPAISRSFADVAQAIGEVDDTGAALTGESHYDGGEGGWSQATHVCWVEVDLRTGRVTIPRYLVVEDCGELINPAIVEGQIRGGVAQGVGAVLYEHAAYDDDANPVAATFMDFLVPTAVEIPEIEIEHIETPSDIEANYRGVGEGGMVGAPAAITNAIENALSHLDVRINESYLPPTRVLELAGVI